MLDSYSKYGLKKVINASGKMTILGVSKVSKKVQEVQNMAGENFFEMSDLVEKTGKYIANLLKVEDAVIVSSVSAGIEQSIEGTSYGLIVGKKHFIEWVRLQSKGMVLSQEYPVYVFDRVGTGDAYTAGISLDVLEKWKEQKMVEFATASAVLAHTTLGDSPILTRKQVELFITDQTIDIVR